MEGYIVRAIVAGGITVASLVGTSIANIVIGKNEVKKYGVATKGEQAKAQVAANQPAPAVTPVQEAPQPAPVPAPAPQQAPVNQAAPVIQPVQFQQQTAPQQQFLGYDATGNPVYGFQAAPQA